MGLFARLFSSAAPEPRAPEAMTENQDQRRAMRLALAEAAKTDPLALRRQTGQDILLHVLKTVQTENALRVETVLGVLGSLAGYACLQQAITRAARDEIFSTDALLFLEGADCKSYPAGLWINEPLLTDKHCIWTFTSSTALQLGASRLFDVQSAVRHCFATITASGTSETFGAWRHEANHAPGDTPQNYATTLWPTLLSVTSRYSDDDADYPLAFAFAIQEFMQQAKKVIDPYTMQQIVMESAIAAAHVPLEDVSHPHVHDAIHRVFEHARKHQKAQTEAVSIAALVTEATQTSVVASSVAAPKSSALLETVRNEKAAIDTPSPLPTQTNSVGRLLPATQLAHPVSA
jgi:hypothetical protein